MNLLPNSCQQTGKKSEKREKRAHPRTLLSRLRKNVFLLLRYNLFMGVNEMRVKNTLLEKNTWI